MNSASTDVTSRWQSRPERHTEALTAPSTPKRAGPSPRRRKQADWDLPREYALDQQRRGLTWRSIRESTRVVEHLLAHEGRLTGVCTEDVEQWLDSCRIGPCARYSYISRLHNFYAWVRRAKDASAVDPTERIIRPRMSRRVPRPISDADLITALIQADDRMKCWLMLAAYEGFRCKEIAGLQRKEILEDHDPPLLLVTNGKGGHPAVLPLNPLTHRALVAYGLPRHGSVFLSRHGRTYWPGTVSTYISRYLHGLGIDASAHRARHWFGTAVWAATKDLRVTQEMLRHADPQTTAGYTAFDSVLASTAVRGLNVRKAPATSAPSRLGP